MAVNFIVWSPADGGDTTTLYVLAFKLDRFTWQPLLAAAQVWLPTALPAESVICREMFDVVFDVTMSLSAKPRFCPAVAVKLSATFCPGAVVA